MKKIIRFSLMVLSLGLMLVSAVVLVRALSQYAEASRTYSGLAASFAPEPSSSGAADFSVQRSIDWAGLQAANPDTAAWLTIDALDGCDYPVMQTDNNDTYLRHNFYGKESSSGSLFFDAACAPDGSDLYRIIYGHNMKNGSMFGSLKKYASEAFYQENGGNLTLYTPDGTHCYEIFSVEYSDAAAQGVYSLGYEAGDAYLVFLQAMQSRSLYDTGVAVSSSSRVLTLSTCSYNDKTRFVIHAVETNFYE